ncbi:MAG: 3-phosphoserine/phosphohydroxythreonine transaminase [Flavobacteriales bacterium]|nr:3-phosphoserine/phosphohydroxythreonine transaminase [Flavobacteriales bacterium]
MTETNVRHNFSAGPCILPKEVFKEASEAVVNFNGSGLSILEISHRSPDFVSVMEEARNLVKEILKVPDNYEVLFLQGGASLGFYISALNFLNSKAGYINTGAWSTKAIKEAKLVGEILELASSKDRNFSYIPKFDIIPEGLSYVHYTSNNTIHGTQFNSTPKSENVICDMSSDIFSKEINVSDYALIYAGAQKNLGPAGTTLYIVNKDLLGKTENTIPSMLDLQVHISKDSMFNTPPVFSVYTSMLTLRWLKSLGGLSEIENINNKKAEILYKEIDRNPLFEGTAAIESRSKMNATFVLTNDTLTDKFDDMWKSAGINGIKGHRSVGGYRASLYNALPVSSVEVLISVMQELEKQA